MDKKKIIIIVGVLAIAGIGYYLYNKSKKASETKQEEENEDASTTQTINAQKKSTKTSTSGTPKKELTSKKEKRKACGRKPLGKNKRAEWQKCVDAGGVASFEGDLDDFAQYYMDFQGEIDNQFMFSEIQNDFGVNMDI